MKFAGEPEFTHLPGFFSFSWPHLDLSWGPLQNPRWPVAERVTWEIKEREGKSCLLNSYCMPDSALGLYTHYLCESSEHSSLKVGTIYHWTAGAVEARSSEGTCPRLPRLSVVFGLSRSCRPQSPCGFQSSPSRGQNPRHHRVWGWLPGCKRKL